MILLIILQLFSSEIDSAISASRNAQHDVAFRIAYSIPLDSLEGFDYYEVLELRALMALRTNRFQEAKQIYKEVIQCDYDSILYKAYINFADVHYYTFNFDKRIEFLQKAYHIKQSPKVIRNIARHHFQIRADYETAEIWINRHTSKTLKDSAGYALLQAEFSESKRQYRQAVDYYTQAKMHAKQANLFNYELFASEGLYRSEQLAEKAFIEKMNNWLYYVIFIIVFYFMTRNEKMRAYVLPKSRNR